MSDQSRAISSREYCVQILGRQIDHRGYHSYFQCLQQMLVFYLKSGHGYFLPHPNSLLT